MHPLSPDLTKLTDAELHAKQSELVKKMNQAYRSGAGAIIGQIQMMLEDYTSESQRRQVKAMEELSKNNPKFDDTIDIS